MLKRMRLVSFISIAAVGSVGAISATANDQFQLPSGSVKNKTYSVWVSQSFASRPFEPFNDCFRFTDQQLCIAGCGGECGPLSEVPLLGIWQAKVSCGGLNLVFIGAALTGPDKSVLGGSAVGRTQHTNFGVEGFLDSSCGAARKGVSPYKIP